MGQSTTSSCYLHICNLVITNSTFYKQDTFFSKKCGRKCMIILRMHNDESIVIVFWSRMALRDNEEEATTTKSAQN